MQAARFYLALSPAVNKTLWTSHKNSAPNGNWLSMLKHLTHLPLVPHNMRQWTGSALVKVMAQLSPVRRQAITWTNADLLSIGPLGTTCSENWIEILIFSFKKMRLKLSSAKWRPFCPRGWGGGVGGGGGGGGVGGGGGGGWIKSL